jgi:hypothetical protein
MKSALLISSKINLQKNERKRKMKKFALISISAICLFAIRISNADEIKVDHNITTSTTWTSDHVYNLQNQIYVLPGATLTIAAGTLVQSDEGGSLAVCRGAMIYALGTAEKPIIMTSKKDDLLHWHEGCNEWGNLTLMGNAMISCSTFGGQVVQRPDGSYNTATPSGLNQHSMEGLTGDFPGDTKIWYGGANDNDDSGALHYVSLRYGGKVIGMGNELNGLSMGGIGRETDVDHIDIMNNVDDGIETWGGTVNYKYISIWNVGDDSFDVDEGWRGKAQFGLLVQGYSTDAAQGSGVGDNCFETDGAEDSDAQPVTTAAIYNFTAIGQPDGDQGTAWRDNARIQYRNCIFMDLGEQLVKFDNKDGDGANGYGYNGTLSWADTWKTPAGTYPTVNAGTWTPGAFNDPAVMYQAQKPGDGMLAEISDSVFFHNMYSSGMTTAYTEAANRGVLDPNEYNVIAAYDPNDPNANMPIQKLVRAPEAVKGGLTMKRVTYINPCAANDAILSVATAPDDGFLTPAPYRGGFSHNYNWLAGWTAAYAYGMTDTSMNLHGLR